MLFQYRVGLKNTKNGVQILVTKITQTPCNSSTFGAPADLKASTKAILVNHSFKNIRYGETIESNIVLILNVP